MAKLTSVQYMEGTTGRRSAEPPEIQTVLGNLAAKSNMTFSQQSDVHSTCLSVDDVLAYVIGGSPFADLGPHQEGFASAASELWVDLHRRP